MNTNDENVIKGNMGDIVNEATFHSYAISKLSVRGLFKKMTAADYMALIRLTESVDSVEESKKIYLEDIANELKLPMGSVSKLARTLRDRGLVTWQHDGHGEDGTYIQITDKGISSVMEQQAILNKFYTNVIERFGKEEFMDLLKRIRELEAIMDSEITKENTND